ncbi:MAG: hypothetical protein R2823_08070 [Acidimicrobiia bacterium]
MQELHDRADVVLLTHYLIESDFSAKHPKAVGRALDDAVNAAGAKPVMFLEFGYPTASLLDGSEEQQAAFVEATFTAWDRHVDAIPLIEFTWSSDAADATIDSYRDYYGIADDRFAAYLGSIGFIRQDGTPKPALDALTTNIATRR